MFVLRAVIKEVEMYGYIYNTVLTFIYKNVFKKLGVIRVYGILLES